jgi:nanoRNase/pAp phosphatase (c-di-AMP/oligoRNAs hydrolase)
MADRLGALLSALDPGRPALVQTHDYPDIDAVASAWALAELLRREGRSSSCAYRGEIRSRSLRRLVGELGISIGAADSERGRPCVVVVDGSPGNGNVTLADGDLVAVIDHHSQCGEARAPYVDERPGLAACSTMIRGYWEEAGASPPGPVATALLAGIQSDTDFLGSRASEEDFAAYASLCRDGDRELAGDIVRTALDLRELGLVGAALAAAEARDGLLYARVAEECGQEALAVLAEFAIRAEELSAAVVAGPEDGGERVSARSRSSDLSAFGLVRRALEGIGTGGGHEHAAGGFVPAASNPGPGELRERFFAAAEAARSRSER